MNMNFGLSKNITIKEILKYNFVMHNIDKKDVVAMDFKGILNLINKFEKVGKQGREKLLILFHGYDNVPEEIYEILEIRKYMNKLIKKVPYLFYFISDFQLNRALLITCIADVQVTYSGEKLPPSAYMDKGLVPHIHGPQNQVILKIPEEIKNLIVEGTLKYGEKINDDVKDILINMPGI